MTRPAALLAEDNPHLAVSTEDDDEQGKNDPAPTRPATNLTTLTRAQRILVGIVMAGAVLIAAIGFAGSYTAVRELAHDKGFGRFADWFPIGVDAGIVVLLALDLLLTWLRIPFPLLRHTAWLLTTATIAFNAASAWGDPLGVGMHATIPVLFVITVEAARHAIGRIADITANRHMEGVRLWRWLLAPIPTFRLWRRMKLWELRSYDQALAMERDRLVYRAHLRTKYGRGWRRRAPMDARMPLKLTRHGVPVAEAREIAAHTLLTPALPHPAANPHPHPPAAFDVAARDALAIAASTPPHPAAPADAHPHPDASEPDAPAPAGKAPANAPTEVGALHPDAPASPTQAGAHPQPDDTAPAAALHPVTDTPGGALVLDLAQMHPLHTDVINRTPLPRPAPASGSRSSASDAELIDQARALAGLVSMRRLQREFGIGQARATRIHRAAFAQPAPAPAPALALERDVS